MRKQTKYNPVIQATAKILFVQENKSAKEIAKILDGPTHQTISNWAKTRSGDTPTWIEEREAYAHALYAKLSPSAQAEKFREKINVILAKSPESFTTKDADALAKMHKAMSDIVDMKYLLPMIFQVLGDLLQFLKIHYPELLSEPLTNAVRHFKNVKIEDAEK